MNTFLSKNWPYLYSIAATAVVIIILYHSCNSIPQTADSIKKSTDSLLKVYADSVSGLKDRMVYLDNRATKDSLISDSLKRLYVISKTDIHEKGQLITNLIDELNKAETDKDIPKYYTSCDSLANEVKKGIKMVGYLEGISDSLITAHTAEMQVKTQQILTIDSLYNLANNDLFIVSKNLTTLELETRTLEKQHKTDQVIKKGALVVIVGLLAKIFIFK
jgi:hypothetical protein